MNNTPENAQGRLSKIATRCRRANLKQRLDPTGAKELNACPKKGGVWGLYLAECPISQPEILTD